MTVGLALVDPEEESWAGIGDGTLPPTLRVAGSLNPVNLLVPFLARLSITQS